MKHEMRRAKQRLSPEESLAILEKGSSDVLALWDGEEPYAVPLSYVYHQGKLYFHCARAGRKLEAARTCPKASFCVVAVDHVIPEKYNPGHGEDTEREISAGLSHMFMLELSADELSGKQGKELLKQN